MMCLSVYWTKQPSIFHGHLWKEKRVIAKLSHMRSRYHWCLLEVDKRDLQPTAKLLTQQKHLLSCMIFSLVTMCMSEHTLKLALDHMVNPYLWNWVSFIFFHILNVENAKFCFKVINLDRIAVFGCSLIWLITRELINWIGSDIQNAPLSVLRETSFNVSHTFFIAISCTFFSHSHYLIYSYYNMDYLYKLKTIEK